MKELDDKSVELVVTSPPYPMVAMWDQVFGEMSSESSAELGRDEGAKAFEAMHSVLDKVWNECFRVLINGGFACINIGDATRKLGDRFKLYPNHSRITAAMTKTGFDCLPIIHWFKPTNSPTKFMGSGMLPSGAYVTLEHEYILVFRKGGKRVFNSEQAERRRRSAFFWEERNSWFSDRWSFKGASQPMGSTDVDGRERTAAYPFELPHRLINMYSMQGDTVLDPFMGTGTTLAAALVNGRGCQGYETGQMLQPIISEKAVAAAEGAAEFHEQRLGRHREYIKEYTSGRKQPAYTNDHYGFRVVTRQERHIRLPVLTGYSTKAVAGRLDIRASYQE